MYVLYVCTTRVFQHAAIHRAIMLLTGTVCVGWMHSSNHHVALFQPPLCCQLFHNFTTAVQHPLLMTFIHSKQR